MKNNTKEPFDPVKYVNDYNAEHYDRILVALPKGYREKLKAAAQAQGVSMTELIRSAIDSNLGVETRS